MLLLFHDAQCTLMLVMSVLIYTGDLCITQLLSHLEITKPHVFAHKKIKYCIWTTRRAVAVEVFVICGTAAQ